VGTASPVTTMRGPASGGARALRVFTWHVHGSYLKYLAHAPHRFFVPVREGRPPGYAGKPPDWPDNVEEVHADEVRKLQFDVVITQTRRNWEVDRHEILSAPQRRLPTIALEHDPPRRSPTEERHYVDDPSVLLVHVTHFNRSMWDNGRTPTTVIEHGVVVPDGVRYTGERERGVVVVNDLGTRDRRVGPDVFERIRRSVPLDLYGMNSEILGGLGELPAAELFRVEARYRFFFNPIRWTSLGLSVCEAMMLGMPVVGLATTAMATTIENGVTGYVDLDERELVRHMRRLLADPSEAASLGAAARRVAEHRFGLGRFVEDWNHALSLVTGVRTAGATSTRDSMEVPA
jgi:glycosyltransferase involved in cell wall biosynthesis